MTLSSLVRSVTTPTTTTEARVLLAQVAEQLAGTPPEHAEEARLLARQLCRWAVSVAGLNPAQRAIWDKVLSVSREVPVLSPVTGRPVVTLAARWGALRGWLARGLGVRPEDLA